MFELVYMHQLLRTMHIILMRCTIHNGHVRVVYCRLYTWNVIDNLLISWLKQFVCIYSCCVLCMEGSAFNKSGGQMKFVWKWSSKNPSRINLLCQTSHIHTHTYEYMRPNWSKCTVPVGSITSISKQNPTKYPEHFLASQMNGEHLNDCNVTLRAHVWSRLCAYVLIYLCTISVKYRNVFITTKNLTLKI